MAQDDALDDVLGVDMKDIGPRYIGPELRRFPDGSWEGVFGERYNFIAYEMGTYPEAVYLPYAGIDDVAELDKLRFPSADWHDYLDPGGAVRAAGPITPSSSAARASPIS